MSTLTLLLVACTLGAITLGLYAGFLARGRAPTPERVAQPPDPVSAVRLPGMPPRHVPAPRAARGSSPPARIGAHRFDDVLTAGLPVVPSEPTDRADYD
jgi:hypothetical protein